MPRVIHFEVPCDDLERARQFYGTVFDWTFEPYGDDTSYWLVTTGKDEPGIDGGFGQRNPSMPQVTNSIGVPSVDEFVAKVEAGGGKILFPRMAVPGMGWLAYCQDTEGNAFGLFQYDSGAR